MTFLAPLWLLGLFPWLAVTMFLLVGRRRRVRIPFVELWRVPTDVPKLKRRIGPPPIALFFAMIAMLIAIVGAGQPAMRGYGPAGQLTIIVDRGASMSAGARYVAAARELASALRESGDREPSIDVSFVPAEAQNDPSPQVDLNSFLRRVEAAAPTAIDTTIALESAVARARNRSADPIVVISDRNVAHTGEFTEVTPNLPFHNAGISELAARASASSAQVMVKICVVGAMRMQATLRVSTGGATVQRPIDLSGPAVNAPIFVDVPALGPTVEASLDVVDDFAADNRAWLARQGSWPRLESQAPLPAGLERVVRMYSAARAPTDDSVRVSIVSNASQLPANSPGIVVDGRVGRQPERVIQSALQVADHPLNKDVNWGSLTSVRIAPSPASPEPWIPIVREGDRVLVAVRDEPAREAWVGFDLDSWQRSSDFVVFWANLFDWCGRGTPKYRSEKVDGAGAGSPINGVRNYQPENVVSRSPTSAPNPHEWPGLYRHPAGALLAVNAEVARPGGETPGRWKSALAARPGRQGSLDLSSYAFVAAVGLILLAVGAWKRSSLTGFSGIFTVASAKSAVDGAGSESTDAA